MVRHCCVPGCSTSARDPQKTLSLHAFPRDEGLREVWLKSIFGSSAERARHKSGLLVCSQHFRPDDFRSLCSRDTKKKLLKLDAVPTRFPGTPQSDAVKPKTEEGGGVMDQQSLLSHLDGKLDEEAAADQTSPSCDAANWDCNLRQLQSRVLPPYIPSNPKFQLTSPPEEFRCQECGDRFLFLSSLKTHTERKSVHISYYCEACEQLLSFYNRCTFLAHVHSHSSGVPADISKAHVVPISREMLDFPPPLSETPPADEVSTASSSGDLQAEEEEAGGIEESASKKISCPECGLLFKSVAARADHLSKASYPVPASMKCLRCMMTCPSRCSLQAHQRTHTRALPYVCPECGELFSGSVGAFRYHMHQVCLHGARVLGHKCSLCGSVLTTLDAVTKHVMASHAEAYYKCDACPMAFKAVVTFINHKAISHPKADGAECRTIYKCPLCDTVFHCSKQLGTHLEAHLREQPCERQFAFRCTECVHAFESKESLAAHITKMHKFSCSTCSLTFHSREGFRAHAKQAHSRTEESRRCPNCAKAFKTEGRFNEHLRICRSKNMRFRCAACGLSMAGKAELATHGRWHIKKDTVLCLLCNNQPFVSRERLCAHLKVHVQGMKYPGRCFQCNALLHGTLDALNHLKGEHQDGADATPRCENPACTAPPDDEAERRHFVCWICRRECFPEQAMMQRHVKNVHGIPSDRPPIKLRIPLQVVKSALEKAQGKRAGGGLSSSSESGSKKAKAASEYVCAKCGFQSEAADAFQAHIASHKTDKRSYQCKECGACFVVEPSLKKHLFIAHKIQDVDMYLAEPESEERARNEQEGGGDAPNNSNVLECAICFTNFLNESGLRTHMRSHGMAFIQSKKSASHGT